MRWRFELCDVSDRRGRLIFKPPGIGLWRLLDINRAIVNERRMSVSLCGRRLLFNVLIRRPISEFENVSRSWLKHDFLHADTTYSIYMAYNEC